MVEKEPPALEVGSTLAGRYELLATIGEGGMGRLFRARHLKVGRIYAVKVLRTTKEDDEKTYRRFLREAKIAGSLSHINLTAVYDYGETEGGYPFIVMDYVDGLSLKELLASGETVELNRTIKIFLQICAGLKYAHDRGLIHRDLKPANVMLVDDEGEEHVKIVDFGIAKELEPTVGDTEPDLTRAGEVFGSPFYLSPEQCLGNDVDARSDVYSLGCLMYETLSGHKPIDGDNTIQIIVSQLQDQPQPFSKLGSEVSVPPELEEIVFRCIEKDPEDRYQSLDAVALELRNFLAGKGADRTQRIDVEKTLPESQKEDHAQPVILLTTAIVFLAFGLIIYAGLVGKTPEPDHTPTVMADRPVPAKTPDKVPVSTGSPDVSTTDAPDSVETVDLTPVKPPDTAKVATRPVDAIPEPPALPHPDSLKTSNQGPTAEEIAQGRKLQANMKANALPAAIHEINKITRSHIDWTIDWSSFNYDQEALITLESPGLERIKTAIYESSLVHSQTELQSALRSIKIKNVDQIYDRHVYLKSGQLVITGAWGEGERGAPTASEIRIAIESGM